MKQFFKHTLGYVGLDYNQKKEDIVSYILINI